MSQIADPFTNWIMSKGWRRGRDPSLPDPSWEDILQIWDDMQKVRSEGPIRGPSPTSIPDPSSPRPDPPTEEGTPIRRRFVGANPREKRQIANRIQQRQGPNLRFR
jgi:hypothetical protein